MTSLLLAGGGREVCGGRQRWKFRVTCSLSLLLVVLALAESGVIPGYPPFLVVCPAYPVYGSVYLREDRTIFFSSHQDVIDVTVKVPTCRAFDKLDLRIRDIERKTVPVVDFRDVTWNKMHYTYDYKDKTIKFMVTGLSTSILIRKWKFPRECNYDHILYLKFDFPSSTSLGRDCFKQTNGTWFTLNQVSVSKVNPSSTDQNFNSKNNVELPRLPALPDFSYKNVKGFSYSSHIAYLPVGLILFMMTVCIRMCIGRSQKPIMQRVRANTVVRLPVGSCSTSAAPGKENNHPPASDSPPTYDDIEKADAPPPSYAEIQILKDYILPKETTTGSQQETLVQIEMPVADSVKEPTDATTATPAEHETSSMKSEVTTAKSNNVKTQSSFRSLKEEK